MYEEMFIGENPSDNERNIKRSSPCDWFFYLDNSSICYVVIRNSPYPSDDIIQQAAQICKYASGYRSPSDVKVSYTQIDNVQLCEEKIGSVNIISEERCKFITT